MPADYQKTRETAQAAVEEIRRMGFRMSDQEAGELVSRIEDEILHALTAQRAAQALNRQLRVSLGSVRKVLEGIGGAMPKVQINASGR